jgi:hypothetical protein
LPRSSKIESGLAIALIIFLVFVTTGAYFVLMFFYPEWVGITGKDAKKTLEEHKEGHSTSTEKDFFKDN